jgi:hypothetical protein
MVFVVGSDPERPLGREDRRAYQQQLKHFLADAYPEKPEQNVDKIWAKVQSKAKTAVDEQGRPILELQVGDNLLQIGVAADNVRSGNAPPEMVRQLLAARLQSELRGGSPKGLSEEEVARDWSLLQKTMADDSRFAARSTPRSETIRGNRP